MDANNPLKQKLVVRRGISFTETIFLFDKNDEPIILTGYTGLMQVRSDYGASVIIELSTSNGRITLDNNCVLLYIADEDTADFTAGSYRYDLQLTDAAGDAYAILYGTFAVKDMVTQV
jgi:hypothetical protein